MYWFVLIDVLVMFAAFFWLPVMRGSESFFMVHVSRDFYLSEGQKILRKYRLALFITSILMAICAVSVIQYRIRWGVIVTPLVLMMAGIGLVSYYRQQVIPHRIQSEKIPLAASLNVRQLRDHTYIGVEIFLAFFTIAPILLLIYYYPELPDQIPAHWNALGRPDRWIKRSPKNTALFPFTIVYMQGLLLMVKNSFLKTKMPLPARHTEEYLRIKESGLKTTMIFCDLMRLALSIMLGTLSTGVIVSSQPELKNYQPIWNIVIWVSAIFLIASVIFFIAKIMSINNRLEELTGGQMPQTSPNDEGWLGGGIIYYNPKDPALFVEKKLGIGNTVNFANKQALYFMAYIFFGLTIIMIWAFSAG